MRNLVLLDLFRADDCAERDALAKAVAEFAALLAGTSIAALSAAAANAEEGRLRIAEQFGVAYLLLNVAKEQQLIEKHGKEAGIDIDVEFLQQSGGTAVNDALLSGSIDVAGADVGPMFTIWDRTKGGQNVKAVASLGNFPNYLVSNRPEVKTIADLTDQHRIALPAVGVSVQTRILQMAVAKEWGDAEFAKLDKISVALPQPAAAAIISDGTEITAHFGNPPCQEQQLAANPDAHVILNSYDVLGGPSSSTLLYATEDFHKDSPKTYGALLGVLQEAAEFVTAHPEEAADIHLKVSGAKTDRDLPIDVINSDEVTFTIQPQNTPGLGQFLHRMSAIRTEPAAVSDYFFEDARIGAES
ncbi:ABC transporter substrate-binding protein [Paracoccus benzoatiresistens]|uniref:ABC transporter substrate-binding protein n=1 Tax=Paracoccus benzoatiresistens TaxID=2997341 RepID=A0ABT4J9A9_9RHOB|nr:ABC transporter substrate-binding protein [Paracoccus sp. EF6]MCZ0963726.1 ABC transporter substrate-binding protein [Paracoccus sp. EF6]